MNLSDNYTYFTGKEANDLGWTREEGDEYWIGTVGKWIILNNNKDTLFIQTALYRRPKRWISVKDKLPETNRGIWVYKSTFGWVDFLPERDSPYIQNHKDVTHWQYADIPTPPEPEVSEEEKAFELKDSERHGKMTGADADGWAYTKQQRLNAWNDALAWQRKQLKKG